MKITDFINRPDADSILVDVEVIVGESDEGLTFTSEDYGIVVEPNEKYMIGDEIELTRSEKITFSDYAAKRIEFSRSSRESDNIDEL